MASKKIYNIATEEWVLELLEKYRNEEYDELSTEYKTIVGAINELWEMVKMCLHPTYDVKVQMFYGVLDPEVVGPILSYKDITLDMIDASDFVSTKPGNRPAINMGNLKEGQYILIAIPTMYTCNITKDDGFGAKVPFDESIVGANGIDVEFNGHDYRLFGELILVEGERKIYIDMDIEDDCNCPDVTNKDIDDIISGLDK